MSYRWRLVLTLGLTETISWGVLNYALRASRLGQLMSEADTAKAACVLRPASPWRRDSLWRIL